MFTLDYPNTLTSWSAPAGTKGNKNTIITNANMMDSWNLYLDEFPSDPTRPPGSTFLVEIFDNGEINITPDMPGGEFYNNN
jgi:hypothetical protein